MFPQIRSESAHRIGRTKDFIREIERIEESERAATAAPGVSRTCKGLIFVSLYAVYEYTVTSCVQATIRALNAHGLAHSAVGAELLALALHPEFSSVKDASIERGWARRMTLAARARCADVVAVEETLFPFDGSHYRVGQLQTIWQVFRVGAQPIPHPRFSTRIEELVTHRNAIAHGRETAEQVGSRFTTTELQERASDTEELCVHVIGALEGHSAAPTSFTA